MPAFMDLTGQVFGKWTVIGDHFREKQVSYWKCRCVCGFEKNVAASSLRGGNSTGCLSCGQLKHGHSGQNGKNNTSPEYNAWANAKRRCTDPNNPRYDDYGGRGIQMAPEWMESFKAFLDHVGPKPDGMILDREDNNGDYEPGNVRWVTYSVSNENRRIKPKRCK